MESGAFLEKIEKIKMPVRIVILVGTVVVLAGLFVWFYYLPQIEAIDKTKAEIATIQLKLNKAKVMVRRLKKFEAEWAELDAQYKEALKLLPNTKEIPTLLKTITQLGSDSQLEFRLFSPQRERPQDFFIEIPVSIEVSGTYHNVAVFFDKVGAMERIVNILNVSMTPSKPRSTVLNTKCDAVTYRFKGEGDVKPAPKK
ncbi:MAG: type 4a pilus biogenesis protein PilO [Deltaproteobacteria bacterium]|nr:type 4a pilus biogenesis protein PilO [Deltaproteobacteria bacterium]